MKNTLLSLILMALVVSSQSCSHESKKEKLEAQIEKEPLPLGTEALHVESDNLIDSADITNQQKSELHELQMATRAKVLAVQEESLKLRSILMKAVINVKDTTRQMATMKKKMKALEMQKIDIIFEAVSRAHKILGHQVRSNIKILDGITFGDRTTFVE